MEFLERLKSIARPLRDFEAAFLGPRRSREKLLQYQRQRHSLEAGLIKIAARWPDLRSESVEAPIFILSAGWRSGSTMLQRLLMHAGRYLIWGEPYSHARIIDGVAAPITCFTEKWPHDAWFVGASPLEDLSRQWVANLYPPMESLLGAHVELFRQLFAEPDPSQRPHHVRRDDDPRARLPQFRNLLVDRCFQPRLPKEQGGGESAEATTYNRDPHFFCRNIKLTDAPIWAKI